MTTKEMIRTYNALAADRGLPPLTGWKASKEALQARIDGLTDAQGSGATPEGKEVSHTTGELVDLADPLAIPEAAEEPSATEAEQEPPSAAEATTDEHAEPAEARGGIGRMIADLLVDEEGYEYGEIVDIVRGEFPEASTSKRSVASVAAALRRKGVEVPMRRKARSVKA